MSNDIKRQGWRDTSPGNPVPNAKEFSPRYQPSPEAKKAGQRRRQLAIQMQEEMEATVGEMLRDPSTDTLKMKEYIAQFPRNIPVGRIVAKLVHRDMLNPKTKPEVRARLLDIYNKIAYGDKHAVDVTTNGESITNNFETQQQEILASLREMKSIGNQKKATKRSK